MNILFLVSSMGAGGAERVASVLCNEWVASGHRVTLCVTFSGRGACAYSLDSQVEIVYLADRASGFGLSGRRRLARLRALRLMLEETKADVVVSFLTHVNVAALLASVGSGIPVVVSERVYPPAHPVPKLLSAARTASYWRAARVVAQTSLAAEWIAKHCPGSSLSVIPNPVSFPIVNRPPTIPVEPTLRARHVLLATGRLEDQKGFDILIPQFLKLASRFPTWELVILGEGSQRERLSNICSGHRAGERVHLLGRVGNMADWYERADLFALSSRYEGFPNALLEAMASGLAVVSVDCKTGPADLIEHEENGLLVPFAEDGRALFMALEEIMGDEKKRARFGHAAQRIRETYAARSIGSSWLELFDSLLVAPQSAERSR